MRPGSPFLPLSCALLAALVPACAEALLGDAETPEYPRQRPDAADSFL